MTKTSRRPLNLQPQKSKHTILSSFSSGAQLAKTLLGGTDCASASTWKESASHAADSKCSYHLMAKHNFNFYTSLLNDYHRRFMTFLKSCAHGKLDNLKFSQLFFHRIHQTLEEESYQVRVPLWTNELQFSCKRKQEHPNNTADGPTTSQSSNNKKHRRGQKREKVIPSETQTPILTWLPQMGSLTNSCLTLTFAD